MMNNPNKPTIGAIVRGGEQYPDIRGYVLFHEIPTGTIVEVHFDGLPEYSPPTENQLQIGPFGFHIHEHGTCDPHAPNQPFSTAGTHYNPTNQPHGNHVGDFPVLFSNHGYSWMMFFSDKFKPEEVVGRAIMVHASPDDYSTQPAGFSGRRIACGVIQEYQL